MVGTPLLPPAQGGNGEWGRAGVDGLSSQIFFFFLAQQLTSCVIPGKLLNLSGLSPATKRFRKHDILFGLHSAFPSVGGVGSGARVHHGKGIDLLEWEEAP